MIIQKSQTKRSINKRDLYKILTRQAKVQNKEGKFSWETETMKKNQTKTHEIKEMVNQIESTLERIIVR